MISGTNIAKLISNEDQEKIITENSILWIRVDPDLAQLRSSKGAQRHILMDYIKLFKDNDIIGQYEALHNIKEERNKNSLMVFQHFIKSDAFFKLRIYALKIYVKLILSMKHEEGYSFLLELLDNYYAEILKNKNQLNKEIYFIMKQIIKLLGDYREEAFNEFIIIGRVNNNNIQNRIIDKFLRILYENDLNIINKFNDSYILREIMLGCSKLNLQEKTHIFLKKIVKCLRIEKVNKIINI